MPLPAPPASVSIAAGGRLFAALARAQAAACAVPEDGLNEHHHYRYTTAETLISAAKAALAGQGLALVPLRPTLAVQELAARGVGDDDEGGARAPASVLGPVTVLHRELVLGHESGEQMTLEIIWPVLTQRGRTLDKAVAGACTTSLAYLLRDLLQIPRGIGSHDDMDDSGRSRVAEQDECGQERAAAEAFERARRGRASVPPAAEGIGVELESAMAEAGAGPDLTPLPEAIRQGVRACALARKVVAPALLAEIHNWLSREFGDDAAARTAWQRGCGLTTLRSGVAVERIAALAAWLRSDVSNGKP